MLAPRHQSHTVSIVALKNLFANASIKLGLKFTVNFKGLFHHRSKASGVACKNCKARIGGAEIANVAYATCLCWHRST